MNSNKHHIERIIKSFKSDPFKWILAWQSLPSNGNCSYDAVCSAYIDVIANEELLNQIIEIEPTLTETGVILRAAILCLVAFEDSGYMADADQNELKILAQLGDKRAILMFVACRILKETENEQTSH